MEEQIMVFSKEWFKKHNKTLCFLANAPIIKYWFRWLLRIHNDIPFNVNINQITPNSFTYNGKILGDKIELTTDFRTHEKFGKRLYYGLKPFWYLLHFWDWSTSIQPALNCGFDTLTVYPDAGTGNTTVDGSLWFRLTYPEYSDWWTITYKSEATHVYASDAVINYIGFQSYNVNGYSTCGRSIATLDTSDLTSDAIISSVTFSLYGTGKTDYGDNLPNIDIYTSTPASDNDLVLADFNKIGSTSQTGSPITYENWSTSAYNNFTFNATGIGNISKTSITRLGIRNANYDVSRISPAHSPNPTNLQGYASDNTGTSQDPKLVVTYTLPITFIPKIAWIN